MRSLTTWTPANVATFDSALDRIFGEFFASPLATNGNACACASADVLETEDAFLVRVDLPGVSKDGISVTIEDGMLTVKGRRESENVNEKSHVLRRERTSGEYTRSFRLGERVDAKHVTAKHENGVLEVRVPKAEEAKPQTIQIQ
jgi:HSP20 family protein